MKGIIHIVFYVLISFLPLVAEAQSNNLVEHKIQPNETLESIAAMYGLSVDELKRLNPDNYKFVYAGFTLKIPAEAKKNADKIKAEQNVIKQPETTVSADPGTTAVTAANYTGNSQNGGYNTAGDSQSGSNSTTYTSSGFNVMNQSGTNADFDSEKVATKTGKGHYGESEVYRRSSLCIIMLTHRGTEYATEMESVFKNMDLPLRYNQHDIDVKVIPVDKDQNEYSISKMLSEKDIAKKVVAKWFNRNQYTGNMDMNLIWERGGYNASYEDIKRAQSTVRGTALISDESIELLQNTFILVCDMDYYDKEKTGQGLAIGAAILSTALGVYGDVQASEGKTDAASAAYVGSALTGVGSVVASDIGGFSVSMNAYLYRLDWSDKTWASICNEYWVDSDTDYSTKQSRKSRFDSDKNTFQLEFIGKYHEKSGKTVFKSNSELRSVIRNVCSNTIQKGMKELARKYPVFRPRAPFYFDNNTLFCRVGTKEDVSPECECEIVEPVKKNGVFTYKVVGTVKPFNVWNNQNIRFDQYFDPNMKGTPFRLLECRGDVLRPGLLIRIP